MHHLRAQALNNLWANHRLLASCAALTDEEYRAARTGFFPSIQATLCHILEVDVYYFAALNEDLLGQDVPPPVRLEFAELNARQRLQDRDLVEFCTRLADSDAQREVRLIRAEGEVRERIDRILLHLFEHQIHHRGQVHCMLSGTSVAPPQLDEFFLVADEPFRRKDMQALGLAEEDIWPR
ncbi:DinB family protein [Pseudomonas sp. JDS28PS106]|uniref:DinB family protein n=1 Tax=Pseudomonas sp. JDS28PS106 TaxID=2497235 RepID=UPI002FD514E6